MTPSTLLTFTKPVSVSSRRQLLLMQIVLLLSTIIVVQGKMEPFIVGGDFASIYRYPHSGFISVDCKTSEGRSSWICGGSIVNQMLILTAAHCLEDCMRSSHIVVVVGNVHKAKGASSSGASYVLHHKYDSFETSHDIGMVKLKSRLQFSAKVRRVALMKRPPYSESANVAGWGIIDEKQTLTTDFLKHIEQKVWNYKECLKYLGSMPAGTLCAGSRTKSDYVAQGDSGSALVVRDFIQIGLVSYKIPAVSESLIVYTDVGYYYDWIRDNAMRMYCDKRS